MKRDPSIHITKGTFEGILKAMEIPYFPTDAFFLAARKNSVDSRAVIASNKKVTKQVDKITLASHGDALLAADLLYATRIKLKQRGVRKITEANQREWTLCKKLADICNTFCDDFGLETREGFITYIEIGLKRLTNYRNLLQRLVSMADSITTQYEAVQEIQEYQSSESIKQGVLQIHDYFVRYIANSTGIYENFKDNPEKYVHACRIHKLLSDRHWNYREYINAQFEALSFCNGVPTLDGMYGDKAIERFNKYLYKSHKSQEVEAPVVEGSLWSKINKK